MTPTHAEKFEANGKNIAKSLAVVPKKYLENKPLPKPSSARAAFRGDDDDDTFVHEFNRNDVRELIHAITQEIKIKGNKTPLVILAFRPKSDDTKLSNFLTQVFPNGAKPAPMQSIERAVKTTDEVTLMTALKYLWARLPLNSVIGWDAYETFKKLEAKSDYPKKAFLEFMPQCLTSPAHASIVYDFLDLLVSLSANAKENSLSGRKISKMAGIWAFHGPPNSASLTKSRLDPTDNSFKEGLRDWLPAADAMFHMLLSFLRSMLPDDHSTKLQLPRTLQALLASNSYPPPDMTYASSTLVSVPLVTITSNSLSSSPIQLLNKIPKVLSFDNPNDFEAKEDYALLKSLCKNNSNILNKLSNESRRIIGLMCEKPFESSLHAGWPEYNPPDNHSQKQTEVAVSRVSIDDYFIWTWMSSMSFEETSAKKKLFGRSLISEFVFDGFKKWIIVEEQNIESSVRNHEPPLPVKPKTKSTQRNVSNPQPHYTSLLGDQPAPIKPKPRAKSKALQESTINNNAPPPARKPSMSITPKLGFLKKFQNNNNNVQITKPLPQPLPKPQQQETAWEIEEIEQLPEVETNQYRLSIPLDSFGFDDDYEQPKSTNDPYSQNFQSSYSIGQYHTTAPPRRGPYQSSPAYYDHDNRYENNYNHQYDPQSHDIYAQTDNRPSRSKFQTKNVSQETRAGFNGLDAPCSPYKQAKHQSVSVEELTQNKPELGFHDNPRDFSPVGKSNPPENYNHHTQPSSVTNGSLNSTSSTPKPRRKPPQSVPSQSAEAADALLENYDIDGYKHQQLQPYGYGSNNEYDELPPAPITKRNNPAVEPSSKVSGNFDHTPKSERSLSQQPVYTTEQDNNQQQMKSQQQQQNPPQQYPPQHYPPQQVSPMAHNGQAARLRSAVSSGITERDSYYSAHQSVGAAQSDGTTSTPTTIPTSDEYQDAEDTMVYEDNTRYSAYSQKRYPESIIETYTAPSVHQTSNSDGSSSFNSPSNQSPHQSRRYSNSSPHKLLNIHKPLDTSDIKYIPEPIVDNDIPIPPPSPTRSPIRSSPNSFNAASNHMQDQFQAVHPLRYHDSNSSLPIPPNGRENSTESFESNDMNHARRRSPDGHSFHSQYSDDRGSIPPRQGRSESIVGHQNMPSQSLGFNQTPNSQRPAASFKNLDSANDFSEDNQSYSTPHRERASPNGSGYDSRYASRYGKSPTNPPYSNQTGQAMNPAHRTPQNTYGNQIAPSPNHGSNVQAPSASRPPRQRSPNNRAMSPAPRQKLSGTSPVSSKGHPPYIKSGPPANAYSPQQGYYPPPAQGYPPQQGYPQYPPRGYAPQGYPAQGYTPQEYPPQGYYPPPQQWYPPPQGYGYPPAPVAGTPPGKAAAAPTNGVSEYAIKHLPTPSAFNKLHRVKQLDKKNVRNALTQGDFGI